MRKSTVGLIAGVIVSLLVGSLPALANAVEQDARRKTPKCRIELVIGEAAGEPVRALICADDLRTV